MKGCSKFMIIVDKLLSYVLKILSLMFKDPPGGGHNNPGG